MKTNRNIPTELRRSVLIEAGHRCAIPTCKHPTTDIHHIVPWCICKDHKFDNLIALCPNCHRRAHSNDIDQKSILLYKKKLSQIIEIVQNIDISKKIAKYYSDLGEYDLMKFEESNNEDIKYEIKIEYPILSKGNEKDLFELNNIIYNIFLLEIIAIRACAKINIMDVYVDYNDFLPITLDATFQIAFNSNNLLSLMIDFRSFTGGAHSNNFTKVVNLELLPVKELKLYTVFSDKDSALKIISEYCIEQHRLSHQDYKSLDESFSFDSGLEPVDENFKKFNITKEGLLFSFDEYQIGCYAEGRTQILVPYEIFTNYLNSYCSISKIY